MQSIDREVIRSHLGDNNDLYEYMFCVFQVRGVQQQRGVWRDAAGKNRTCFNHSVILCYCLVCLLRVQKDRRVYKITVQDS